MKLTLLAAALAVAGLPACKKGGDSKPADANSATDPAAKDGKIAADGGNGSNETIPDQDQTALVAGITPAIDGIIAVAGQLAIGTDDGATLTDGAQADTVRAFPIVEGRVDVLCKDPRLTSPIAATGKFTVNLTQAPDCDGKIAAAAGEIAMIKAWIKDDSTLADGARAKVIDYAKGDDTIATLNDAAVVAKLKGRLHQLETGDDGEGHGGGAQGPELSYALVAYKASATHDRVQEAASFKFVGLPAGGANLINFPVKAAKGNLGLGQIKVSGNDATSQLPADTNAFAIEDAVLKQMASTNDALKALVNKYMNTEPETALELEATPFYMWSLAGDPVTGMSLAPDEAGEIPNYFSSYIAVQNQAADHLAYTFDKACAADEGARDIWAATWPAPIKVLPKEAGGAQVETTGRDNKGAFEVGGEPHTEYGGSTRKSCGFQTGAYFSGYQINPNGLEQVGLIDRLVWDGAVGIPAGLFKVTRNAAEVGRFDFAVTSPLNADKRVRVFVPELTTGKACNFTLADIKVVMKVWDEAAQSYVATSGEAFGRVVTEFGGSTPVWNSADHSNGGNRTDNSLRFTANGKGAFTIDPSVEGTMGVDFEHPTHLDLPSCAQKGVGGAKEVVSFFLYYRAFGNSYNFQSSGS